jgi:short-subunit dehydrogenase
MTGQRALITAGAAGIGRAMGAAFAAQGADIWVVDVDEAALAACPKAWRRDRIDVSDEGAVAGLFARLTAEWGGLEVLCANAGIAGPTARPEDMPPDGFRDCVAVNLEGAFLFARDALYAAYAGGTSMRSFVEAKDVANMAVFLASPAARFVTGQIIAVDGHTENPDPKL